MEFLLYALAFIYFISQKCGILFSVLFFILPIAYYFLKRIPKVSKYVTYKTVINSTLLGAIFGVCANSFFILVMCSLGNYPVQSAVNGFALAISAFGFFPIIYLYWVERIKNGAKWWIVDMFYSLIIFFAASGLYITVYTFAEKHFGGIW